VTHRDVVGPAKTSLHPGRALIGIDILELQHEFGRFDFSLRLIAAPSANHDKRECALDSFRCGQLSFGGVLRPRRNQKYCRGNRQARENSVNRHNHSFYGASVGGDSNVTRPFRPDDTRTVFFSLTMIPSTSGNCSISCMPFSGPSTNIPVESPSAMV